MQGDLLLPDNRLRRPLGDVAQDLPPAWRDIVLAFLGSLEGQRLAAHLSSRLAAGADIFPADPFRALRGLPPQAIRVVILGQDPYHGPGEAQGLAFSVASGVRIPPSLRNIRLELVADLGLTLPDSGDLSSWASAGVLLLNTCLTVERDQPASHAKLGWERLTDRLVSAVAAESHPKVFMLWGAHAQAKAALIREAAGADHLILASNHPSPLSARRPPVPFLGSRPFSRANEWLRARDARPVDWSLSHAEA